MAFMADHERRADNQSTADLHLRMVNIKARKLGIAADDQEMILRILSLCLVNIEHTPWCSLSGYSKIKRYLRESVMMQLMYPDFFDRLGSPGRCLLLFGPPGTGKKMIGKCIATHTRAKFLCVSGAALTSMYYGEAERMVCSLFLVARTLAPAIIFFEDAENFLSTRHGNNERVTTLVKNLLLQEMGDAVFKNTDGVMVIAATNRPHLIDGAARRRFVSKVYLPLPDTQDRQDILRGIIREQTPTLSSDAWAELASLSNGWSAADLKVACEIAATAAKKEVRAITYEDIKLALTTTPQSGVSEDDLRQLEDFNLKFGDNDIFNK